MRPASVHPVNLTSITSTGSTQTTRRACSGGTSVANGDVGRCSGVSRCQSMSRACWLNPVPTWPAYSSPPGPCTPMSSEPNWPARWPSPGFQPPTTTSCRPRFLILRQLPRSEEHTSELQSRRDLVCRLLLEKEKAILYIPRGFFVEQTNPLTP